MNIPNSHCLTAQMAVSAFNWIALEPFTPENNFPNLA
ncbi:MAG: hypothetical protein M2R45_03210 [Verrucomicrobia subdivision 3 bacterium]|nr:hypothetical protein [Limisphaerales bacterium]MCS1413925.1 hypothetical protein [Limisphaerales bacterium]